MKLNRTAVVVCLSLGGCLLSIQSNATPSVDGADKIAEKLNLRFNDTRQVCDDNQSPYKCSGVLMRKTMDPNHALGGEPWGYNNMELEKNALKFSYVRADINNNNVDGQGGPGDNGLVVNGQDESIQGYCVFPGSGMVANRDANGCGTLRLPGLVYPHIIESHVWPDFSTCSMRGIHTAAEWINDNDYQQSAGKWDSCSFNPDEPAEFTEFIKATNQLGASERNEIYIQKWNKNKPEQLPIEAFWFVTSKGKQNALRDQAAYYDATGVILPILRYSSKSENPFQAEE